MLDIVEYVTIQSSKLSQLYILGLPKYNTRLSLCSILCDLKEILNVYAIFTPVYIKKKKKKPLRCGDPALPPLKAICTVGHFLRKARACAL